MLGDIIHVPAGFSPIGIHPNSKSGLNVPAVFVGIAGTLCPLHPNVVMRLDELLFLLVTVCVFPHIHDFCLRRTSVQHPVEETGHETILRYGEHFIPTPRDRIHVGDQNRNIRELCVHRFHPLVGPLVHFGFIFGERFRFGMFLLLVGEKRITILLHIEQETFAATLLGDLGRNREVLDHHGPRLIVEPIHVPGAHAQTQESISQATKRSGLEIFDGLLKRGQLKPPATPYLSTEVAALVVGNPIAHDRSNRLVGLADNVKDHAIEW